MTQPDSGSVTNEYFLTGALKKTYGARTYPVEYTYDYAGRMKTMKTWQNFASASGAAVTTWNYDSQRGFLANKRYADNQGPNYTYTSAGRLATRAWARGITTTYTNNNAGELSGITYTGNVTPAVGYTFDRRGRQTTVTQGANTTVRAYNDAGQLLSESHTAGLLNGLSVTNEFDPLLRRTALKSLHNSSLILHTSYAYDVASRLASVGDGTNNATYTYLANSPLVDNVVFKQNSTTRMTTTKQYDNVNRLTQISSVSSASSAGFAYTYNDANQRTRVTLADGSYWLYAYDNLGQVVSGKKYWSDNSPVAGQQFEYGFDDIGNRKTTKAGGDGAGANLRQANYSANALNQYTARTVPGFADIIGVAHSNATVTVNLQPTSRKGMFFRKELALNNSVAPVYRSVTNVAVLITGGNNIVVTNIGSVFLPQTPEAYSYDADGNLLSDGRWTLTWDAENRLIRVVSVTGVGPQQRIDYAYDHQSRRISKKMWNNTAGSGSPALDERFLYDGWNLIAVLSPNSQLLSSYTWGLDLSGSLQGAGGVGGLLAENLGTNGVHFAAMDGSGNVSALVSASDGTISASYEYAPFGELLRSAGVMARLNPFRFSTKYQDDETGWLYYGYRYYNASTGRWVSRDPLEEEGGANLFLFVNNGPSHLFDKLGLECCLITYPAGIGPSHGGTSIAGHSALQCGSTYISFWPINGHNSKVWHDPIDDDKAYPHSKPTRVCFKCLNEDKVKDWKDQAIQNGNVWTVGNNCADATSAAIAAGLPEPQTKPNKCPCAVADKVHRWVVKDLLDSVGIVTPTGLALRVSALAQNKCQRYKCVLENIASGH